MCGIDSTSCSGVADNPEECRTLQPNASARARRSIHTSPSRAGPRATDMNDDATRGFFEIIVCVILLSSRTYRKTLLCGWLILSSLWIFPYSSTRVDRQAACTKLSNRPILCAFAFSCGQVLICRRDTGPHRQDYFVRRLLADEETNESRISRPPLR